MKKGFTLIELLAVIVILAIIAIIATPLILNVIEDSKKGAFKNSAHGIIEAAEISYATSILEEGNEEIKFIYNEGEMSSEPTTKKLEYKGSKPQNGEILVNREGKVTLAIHNGKYCAKKKFK